MSIRRTLRLTRHVILVDHTRRSFPEYEAYELLPRRVPAAAGIGVLMLAGAVGTYFAVAGGLGVLLARYAPPAPDGRSGHVPTAVDSPASTTPPTRSPSGSPSTSPGVWPSASASHRDPPPSRRSKPRPTRAATPTATPTPTCVCTPSPEPTPTSRPTVTPTATTAPSPPEPDSAGQAPPSGGGG